MQVTLRAGNIDASCRDGFMSYNIFMIQIFYLYLLYVTLLLLLF